MAEVLIRTEEARDRLAVHALNESAFETSAEADLVDELREKAHPIISLVAERRGRVAGHILFTPVTLSGHPEVRVAGLAPMAVAPSHQRKGIGSALVRAGLEQCREAGFAVVAVLGHPTYYPRFGFVPSTTFAIECEYDVPDEVFMLLELEAGALSGKSGTIRYHPAFSEV